MKFNKKILYPFGFAILFPLIYVIIHDVFPPEILDRNHVNVDYFIAYFIKDFFHGTESGDWPGAFTLLFSEYAPLYFILLGFSFGSLFWKKRIGIILLVLLLILSAISCKSAIKLNKERIARWNSNRGEDIGKY